jgi:dTDP-glucose 4,6-dehydratase
VVVVLDALTYASNRECVPDDDVSLFFVRGNICDRRQVGEVLARFGINVVVNLAAESHNSVGMKRPSALFETNLMGTVSLLEASRLAGVRRFHHVSSSEVYGELPENALHPFKEGTAYRPSTPYSASKAGADHAVRTYHGAFGLATTISVSCNNYGPFQFPEKLIPLFTVNALQKRPLPMYSATHSTREYIHVTDHCAAIETVLLRGAAGKTYHVGSGVEVSIEQVADVILDELSLPDSLKRKVPDRPLHGRRHALDSSMIRSELGWSTQISFEVGLRETVRWYRDNTSWWKEALRRMQVAEEEW